MKIIGIILALIGGLSIIGATIGALNGHNTSFGGLIFLAIGIVLITLGKKR